MVQRSLSLYDRLSQPDAWTAPHVACRGRSNAYAVSDSVIWIDGQFWFVPSLAGVWQYQAAYQVKPVTKIGWDPV
jgi:hypothetical protein